MNKIPVYENKFCHPCDRDTGKEGIPLDLRFEFVVGALTNVPAGEDTAWRTMPFHLCCFPFGMPLISNKTRLEIGKTKIQEYQVASDKIIFIPAGTPHRISDLSAVAGKSLWIHFRLHVFGSFDLMDFFDIPPILPENPQICKTLLTLTGLPSKLNLFDSIRQQIAGFELTGELLKYATPKKLSASWHKNATQIMPVIRILTEKPEQLRSTPELAETVNLSVSRFLAVFHHVTGMSPGAFRENARFRQACNLLLEKNFTITEIAESLGYSDPFHFSRKFKERAGISPKFYRMKIFSDIRKNPIR